MGTETNFESFVKSLDDKTEVKLNNPLMGTETCS